MRYYSTQRPIMPGSYPKPAGNPVVEIRNFDARVFCGEIGREAWGYIEYEQALFPGQAQSCLLYTSGIPLHVFSRGASRSSGKCPG